MYVNNNDINRSIERRETVKDTTCFVQYAKFNVTCNNTNCRMWIDHNKGLNCTILAARTGPRTLQEIGEIFSITRMRICQIEKKILKKLAKKPGFVES